MSESMISVFRDCPWVQSLLSSSMKIAHAWVVEWTDKEMFQRQAGQSDKKYKDFSRQKRRMQWYFQWKRWTWLVDINGRVIARVHPRWWRPFLVRRTIFETMSKIGDKINDVTYIVEVSQHKDEKILRVYKPMRGSTFTQLFNDAVEKERRRGKPVKRITWSKN